MDGKLAGINSAIFTKSGGSIGIGFAIPANLVSSTVASALAGQGVKRPCFGAPGETVTFELARSPAPGRPGGVLDHAVYRGGPAVAGKGAAEGTRGAVSVEPGGGLQCRKKKIATPRRS